MNLPYQLDRVITIAAPRETVFSFFTDNARWAAWWGKGSTIDARPGGRVHVVHPNNVEMSGEVVALSPPDSITFTYGYGAGGPIPPGGSLVTIRLEPHIEGTRLHLTHTFSDIAQRDHHVQGWRFQLSLFSNAVLNLLHDGADSDRGRVVRPLVGAGRRLAFANACTHRVAGRAVSRSVQRPGGHRRGGCARHRRAALHAGTLAAAPRLRSSLPGCGAGRLGRHRGPMVVRAAVERTSFMLGPDGRIVSATGFWATS